MPLLYKLLRGRKFLSLLTILIYTANALITLWWNALLSVIINAVSEGVTPSTYLITNALIIILIACAASFAKGCAAGFSCEGMARDLRVGYARHFARLPFAEVEKLNAGEEMSKLQNEIAGVSNYLTSNLFQLFDDAVRFVLCFTYLMILSPGLTLASNLPALLILAYVFWSSKKISAANLLSQQAKGEMNRHADTLLTLFPVIKLYNAERMTLTAYKSAAQSWENSTVRLERVKAGLMSLSGLLSNYPLLLLFLVGGGMVISGGLTVGALYVFINLSGNVTGTLTNMPGHISALRQFTSNMNRLEGRVCL